jgi:tRNA G37 N-methylase TrmD
MKNEPNLSKFAAQIQETIQDTSSVEEPDFEEENPLEKPDYTKLPNYEEIKHFEQNLTDDQFMDIII